VHAILHPEFRNQFEKVADTDFFGRAVKFQAQVVRIDRPAADAPPSILASADNTVFPVRFADPGGMIPPAWVEGALLELVGVPEPDFKQDPTTQGSFSITGMTLWLGSPADVRVLAAPSWWTAQRLAMTLAGVLAVLIIALAWILALRRLVKKRGRMLEDLMRSHRDSELEFRAAQQERRRLAGDLHDGLQQLMAGAAYRVEAAAAHLGQVPPAVEAQLTAARRALVRSQTGLREALWGLQQLEEEPNDFVALLRHAVGSVEHWPAGAVEVAGEGTPFPVSREVMGSLLLLMQESVGNAFTHGKARQVRVALAYDPEALAMRIEDDGCGFDPARAPGPKEGHFGLESTRLRMKWLSGTVEILSTVGKGTTITCRLPAARARAAEARPATPAPIPAS
jgi:signal transduction histidine kinase